MALAGILVVVCGHQKLFGEVVFRRNLVHKYQLFVISIAENVIVSDTWKTVRTIVSLIILMISYMIYRFILLRYFHLAIKNHLSISLKILHRGLIFVYLLGASFIKLG